MDRIAELLCGGRIGIVGDRFWCLWFVAVRTPMPFVLSGIGVIHDHAVVAITVSDVYLVGLFVDEDFCRSSKVLNVVAAFALSRLADLHQELSSLREFQNHRVVGVSNGTADLLFILDLLAARPTPTRAPSGASRGCADAVAADPDVAFVVDGDSVIGIWPIVTLTRSAPTRQQVALLIEVQNGRCGLAAHRNRWIACCVQLTGLERACAMDDPDVVFVIDRDADRLALQPMI